MCEFTFSGVSAEVELKLDYLGLKTVDFFKILHINGRWNK